VPAPGFEPPAGVPVLRARNKRDLHAWIDAVIRASQDVAGFHLVSSDDEAAKKPAEGGGGAVAGKAATPAPHPPPSSAPPAYIAHRTARVDLPDGRRGVRWWLVDAAGVEWAAASGEERGARDGHYEYATDASLPGGVAMECQNQAGVMRYLETMIAGGGGVAALGGGAAARCDRPPTAKRAREATPSAAGSPPPPDAAPAGPVLPTIAELAAARPAGRAGLVAALAEGLPPDPPLAADAEAALASRARVDAAAAEATARLAVAAEARARGARAGAALDAAKRVAVRWLRAPPGTATKARAEAAAHDVRAALASLGALAARSAPAARVAALAAAHAAVRDAAGLALSPKLAAAVPALVPAVLAAAACSDASVAAAAAAVLTSWRGATGARLAALTRRDALADPDEEVEAVLAAGAAAIDAAAAAEGGGDGGTPAAPSV
jgi:hypothetical protein